MYAPFVGIINLFCPFQITIDQGKIADAQTPSLQWATKPTRNFLGEKKGKFNVEELKAIFKELDRDGYGSISMDELRAGLGERENGEELLRILQAADTDGNGAINYTGEY